MRIDRANRNFLVLAGIALVPYVVLMIVGCGLLTVFVARLFDHGLGFLTVGPGDLRAAAVVLAVLLVGTARAVYSIVEQYGATVRLAARVRDGRIPTGEPLRDVACRVGIGDRVRLVDDGDCFSFTYGLTRPRVAVSRGLVESASSDELAAVLTHERYHVANLDPLKVVLARVLSSAYFFLPALRGLWARYSAASELAADREALGSCGRSPLAGALHRVVRGPEWSELHTAAAIGGPELLELRIAQMEENEEPAINTVPIWSMVLTILVLVVFASVILGTIAALGGPDAMGRQMMGGAGNGMGMSVADTIASLLPWVLLVAVGALAWHRSRTAQTLQ